jgi:hypothetical protein
MSDTYLNTTDRAAIIRKALKVMGWTSRDVSVRGEYYSLGSTIHVTIKNPHVPIGPVEDIANAHERIDRDQFGEILGGGNRFVYVKYSSEATDALAAPLLPALQAAEVKLKNGSENVLIPIDGTPFLLGRDSHGWGLSLWDSERHLQNANSLEYLASTAAIKLQTLKRR